MISPRNTVAFLLDYYGIDYLAPWPAYIHGEDFPSPDRYPSEYDAVNYIVGCKGQYFK